MPQITALSQLGDVILRASDRNLAKNDRKQREEEARMQMLADLADQRQYSEGQNQQARMNRFEDQTQAARFNSRFESLQRAEKLGLIAATDIGKIEIENMALQALATREAAEEAKRVQFKAKAKTRLDKLAKTEDEIVTRIQRNQAIADTPIQPEDKEIRVIQERLARAANPKEEQISEELIAFQEGAAIEQWKQTAMVDKMQRAQAAKIDAANDRMLLREIAQERNSLMQMSGEIGDVPETVLRDPNAGGKELPPPPESPMVKLQRERAEKLAAEKAVRDAAAGANPVGALADPTGGYGGIRGATAQTGQKLSGLINTGKLIANVPYSILGRGFDSLIGGDKAVQEGEVGRNQRLAGLVQDYNQTNPVPITAGQAMPPLASRLQDPNAPKPLTYEQFLQFQDQLKKPLPKLNPLRTQAPTSVFSYPDPYGSMGN